MKPVPSLFFASTHYVQVGHFVNSIVGVVLCAFGLFILEAGALTWRVALFPLMLVSALAIFYAFVVAMTTLVFWAVRLEGLESMFNVFFRTSRYPVDIYPKWIKGFLTYLFPVAFVSTVAHRNLGRSRFGLVDSCRTRDCDDCGVWGYALLAFGTQAVFERLKLDERNRTRGASRVGSVNERPACRPVSAPAGKALGRCRF